MLTKLASRNRVAMLHDTAMAALSFVLALYLRLGDQFAAYTDDYVLYGTALFTAISLAVFSGMKFYRSLWRYASVRDLINITKAVTLIVLIFFPLLFLVTRLEGVPRSVPLINWLLLVVMLGAPRFAYRLWKENHAGLPFSLAGAEKIPVLLVGATSRAELFLRDLSCTVSAPYRVVAITDDRKELIGRSIHNVRIRGSLEHTVEKLTKLGLRPQKVIVTDDAMDGDALRLLLEQTDALGIPLARLPRLTEFKSGASNTLDVRPIAVEDLLGRSQTARDREFMRQFVAGRKVLITGAGGTIGSELVRQVAEFAPSELILLERSEFHLYEIDREMGDKKPEMLRQAILGDVRDTLFINRLFATTRPEIVFHAAAIKHVPIAEANAEEAMLINVKGTQNVADACARTGTKAMVLISTDKAVNPTNVMGASKRLAERYCQGLATGSKAADKTRFITVRFGNVLGSTGSVVPLFQQQLAKGGPLTVTHAEMERYFMTVREAVELVILASAEGSNLEQHGAIFVLDMGKPVKIIDLAHQMIRLAGLRPGIDVKVEFTGLRPGEKLHEELFYDSENLMKTPHESLMLAHPDNTPAPGQLYEQLQMLYATCDRRDEADALRWLARLVPEYRPAPPVPAAKAVGA